MTRERHVRFCEGGGVRFLSATRLIAGFQHEPEARAFLQDLQERLRKFELALHPAKTRLIRFGRHAAREREKRGRGSRKLSTSSASRISARDPRPGDLSSGARRSRNGWWRGLRR